ncbi:hypothetical protein [Corynebacterium renale]|nr:hypothetical protein [Corynebacterium renale]SQI22166.1 hypothetical membrane protein [Corynebacterium renale]
MSTAMIITMASVALGFCCVGGAFALFMYSPKRTWVWVLGILALILLTIVPVTLAITSVFSPDTVA